MYGDDRYKFCVDEILRQFDILLVVPALENVQSFKKIHPRRKEKFDFEHTFFQNTNNVTPGEKTRQPP